MLLNEGNPGNTIVIDNWSSTVYIAVSSPCGEYTHRSAADSTAFNANFIHQVAYISQSVHVMITIEGP